MYSSNGLMQMIESLGDEELDNNLTHRLAPYPSELDKNSTLCDH